MIIEKEEYKVVETKRGFEIVNNSAEHYKLMKVVSEKLNKVYEIIYIYSLQKMVTMKEYEYKHKNIRDIDKKIKYKFAEMSKKDLMIEEFYQKNRS